MTFLSIHITYIAESNEIKFEIAERQEDNQQVFFDIRDRSKGFYWFFNFVMRLQFNPQTQQDGRTVYLLDEPGSYLHARAQDRLCHKLRELSRDQIVIYCTHSHYLLSPQTIPINAVRIVERDSDGGVSLHAISDHPTRNIAHHAAFQPILEALQVKPSYFDTGSGKVLITEGIYDFFALDAMKSDDDIKILPALGAESIRYHISMMMAWRNNYVALWDNDKEGRAKFAAAADHFGQEEADRSFRLLPLLGRQRKRILQDLFDGRDLSLIKTELGLPRNVSFRRAIIAWYYSDYRDSVKQRFTTTTHNNFSELFDAMWS